MAFRPGPIRATAVLVDAQSALRAVRRACFTPKRSLFESEGPISEDYGERVSVCAMRSGRRGPVVLGDCAPVDTVRQSATVKMSGPISTWIEGGVGQQQAPPPSRVEIRTRVRPDPDRKPARTVTAVDKWNYDRGRVERCTIYTDRIDNLFVEVYRVCDLRSLHWLMRIGGRPVTSTHTGAGEPVAGVWRGGLGCHWIVATSTRVCVLAEVPPDRRR